MNIWGTYAYMDNKIEVSVSDPVARGGDNSNANAEANANDDDEL